MKFPGMPDRTAFQAITGNHHSKIPKICHCFVSAPEKEWFSLWFAVTSLIESGIIDFYLLRVVSSNLSGNS